MLTPTTRRGLTLFLGNAFSVALVIVILFKSIGASTATDGSTPLAMTPGAPAGSYPLSGLDNINLFNGNLNFYLPLLAVGGRGSANYPITRMIEQHWRVNYTVLSDGRELNIPLYNPWTPLDPGYSPGVVYGRQVSDGSCQQGNPSASTLTRLTFVAPDGTEYELVDKVTMGQPQTSFCWAGLGYARGTVFVSTNGASVTFVSDSTIHDNQFGTASTIYATGYLMMPDGMRFRLVNGRVEWLRDRNGNQVTITYPTSTRMIATDSLGRQVIVDKNVSEGSPYGLCDKITFNGFSGTQRFIRVSKTNLGSVLRSGYSLQTPAALFPQLDGSSSTNHDPQVISAIWLPDGRSYQFRYNSYGELARVELPTGGAFEYDYAAGLVGGYTSGVFYSILLSQPQIYRRAIEKRIYKEGGALEHKMTISRTDSLYANDTMVTVDKLNSGGALLARSKHYFFGNPAHSFDVQALEYQRWKHGREFKTEAFDVNGTTVLRRQEHAWHQPAAGTTWPLSQPETNDAAKPNDPQITQTVTTLEPATANQVSKQTFAYDQYSNITDTWEYGFGVGGPPANALRRRQTSYITVNPVNSLDYASPNPTASSIYLRMLPQHQRVYSVNPSNGQETLVGHTEIIYDETALNPWYGTVTQWADPGGARGNATRARNWLNPGGTWLESRAEFDQVGNVSKSWDRKNNLTQMAYSSTYHFALPTQTTSPVPDPTGQHGSATAFVTTTVYDFSTGLVTSTTDANNQTTNVSYNDALERPTQVVRAVGTSIATQTTFSYDDANRTNTVTADLHAYGDNVIKTQTLYDGLGRDVERRQYEGGSNYIAVRTEYDALGRAFKMSNPFRPWQSENPIWTTRVFDALDRVTSVTTPDNAVVNTSYSGASVTVTDQAGKARKTVTDALGRLIEVYEDPNGLNYQTVYLYNALDNLVKVTQGSQQRFFMFDSLSRLIRSRNPEQSTLGSLALADPITGNSAWSIGYQYDANNNLTQKTDARGVVSVYAYDAINRNTTLDYSDTASINPDVRRFYDGATNGKGRFWYFYKGGNFSTGSNVDHTSIDSYDALGRPLVQRQLFKLNGVWGPTYQVSRNYNRAGSVTSQTYPSGRSVTYNYDAAGRLADKDVQNLAFTGNLGDGVVRTYSSEILYSPFGSLAKEKFGTTTPIFNKLFYNVRGQLAEIRESTSYTGPTDTSWNRGAIINHYSAQCWGMCSGSPMPDNNGTLKQQDHFIPDSSGGVQAVFVQAYTYDSLNRLLRVQEGSWQQEFAYDRWGNRTIHQTNTWGTGINKKDFTVNTANNRLGVPGGQSGVMTYDAAGNVTNDTYTGAGIRVYDGENRMTEAHGSQGANYYVYDAEGRRTRRKINNQETWQVFGFEGELLAEYPANGAATNPQKEYGYRNGQLLITTSVSSGGAAQNVNWTNTVGVSVSGNNLTKTAGTDWYNARASSTQAITSGEGYVEFTASETTTNRMLGLGEFGNGYYTYSNIRYAIYLAANVLYTSEYGALTNVGTYATGDTMRVAIEGAAVRYYKNGALLRTSAIALTYPLYANVALYNNGATLTGAVINNGSGGSTQINWLVADHLGTPRMIFDQTGSLANVKRHDYLPFGEELFPPTGGRTAAMGYSTGDGVRQQFTSKERDIETGLDYFGARYYTNTQGRFLSVDPQNAEAASDLTDPQGWNGYAYVKNNPCSNTDPDGRCICPWERLKNAAYGFRSNQEVQALEDKWRNYLREKQQQYGTLIWNEPGNPPFIVDPNTLSRDQVFYYARRLRDAEYDGTLRVYSAEDVQKIMEAQGIAQPPPIPVLVAQMNFDPKQLQKKFKHAGDFGITGKNNPANQAKFQQAMEQHINDPLTKVINGTYHGKPVTHYLNPSTGLNVMKDASGNYLSGWKLNQTQLANVMFRGSL